MIEVHFHHNLRVTDNSVLSEAMAQDQVVAIAQQPTIMTAQDVFRYQQLRRLHRELAALGVPLVLKEQVIKDKPTLLHDVATVVTKQGTPYKVFTPFYKACLKRNVRSVVAKPMQQEAPFTTDFPQLALPQWAQKISAYWPQDVQEVLANFTPQRYAAKRDFPSEQAISYLSPYLAVGAISPMQLHATFSEYESFIRQLIWRDFAHYTLAQYPLMAREPLREHFNHFPYQRDEQLQVLWQQGKTGYPLVDAGMRELYATGYMHNRVRMVCASFFTKHLLQPWQDGAKYFSEQLVDYDLANNAVNWQWVAGCGIDASPYFRIFNPLTQRTKFKAEAYIKKWLPADYNVLPIVDHKAARARALAAYDMIKGEN